MLVGLERPPTGSIRVDGVGDCNAATGFKRGHELRKTVPIVFQDPYSSLDRTETVGAALREVLVVNKTPSEQVKMMSPAINGCPDRM